MTLETDAQFIRDAEELDKFVRRTSSIIKKRGREILTDFDITPPQFNALLFLKKYGNLTIGELGEKMYLACSTATDLIDRMERNGLVERVRDKNDRRVVRLNMLEKGYQMYEEVLSTRHKYMSSVLEKVAVEDRHKMLESMQLLYELMTAEKVE